MYSIVNIHTRRTLCTAHNLRRANQIFYRVRRRKYSTIALIDNTTGEVLKSKDFESKIYKCKNFITMLKGDK